MEILDTLEEILSNLEDEDIVRLKLASKELLKFVEEVEKDEEYWRKRLSNYLDFEVSERVDRSWKEMYKNVAETKKNFDKIVKLNYVEIVSGLLKQGVDPSADKNAAFLTASRKGYTEIVKLLLADSRVDPTYGYMNLPFRQAARNGHIEIVKLLLKDPRTDPSDDENLALHLAKSQGHTEIVKLLLADPRVIQDLRIRNELGHYGPYL